MSDLEDALQRLGELEQRELLTGIAQVTCHLLHRRITVVSYSLLGPSD